MTELALLLLFYDILPGMLPGFVCLHYAPEFGIDLRRFLDPNIQIQNETFESYSLPYKPYDDWISILLELASLHYQRGYILLSGKEKTNIERTKKLARDALDRCMEKMPDSVSAEISYKIRVAEDKDEELLWTYIFAMGRYDIEHK